MMTTVVNQSAKSAHESPVWLDAMKKHIDDLEKLNVFTPCKLPPGKVAIKARWVYAKKGSGPVYRYKARYVGKGFMQVPGRDYHSSWSPTVRLSSLHILIVLAALHGRYLFQFDVCDAYLTADLDVVLYVEAPPNFYKRGIVWLLKKAMPGLKQSGQAWYKKLSTVMGEMGFTRCKMDPCVFVREEPGGKRPSLVAVHVDDGILVCDDKDVKTRLYEGFSKHFKVKDLGFPKSLLGCQYERKTNGDIFMHQEEYIREVLKRCDFTECNPVATPAIKHPEKSGGASPSRLINSGYSLASISGALGWLARNSRPDINYAWAILAQHITDADQETQWRRAGRILRYLKGTAKVGVLWKRQPSGSRTEWTCFTDADWGGPEHKKSQTGWMFLINNQPLLWASVRQRCVSLSTAQAEIIAMADGIKNALALQNFFYEIKVKVPKPFPVYVDNEAAVKLAKTSIYAKGLRHVNLRYSFVNDEVRKGNVAVHGVKTEDQMADILTKAMLKVKHWQMVDTLLSRF